MKSTPTSTLVRRRRQRRSQRSTNGSHRLIRVAVVGVVSLLLAVVLLVGGTATLAVGIYAYYAHDLPDPDSILKVKQQFETTLIYDRSGQNVLYQVLDPSGGDRQSMALTDIPANLINATIAIEDKSFYQNPGFDIRGIVRAVWLTLQGETVQGGSTITQQLVKNILFAPEGKAAPTVERKIKEIILSSEISRRYSKAQILEWYLNNNFYGNLAYGIHTAAKVYFGKRVQDLSLGEAAMLAAIPQNPQLNPIDNPAAARQRQGIVLDSMVALGLISAQDATDAKSQAIVIQPVTERYGIVAPHFALFARHQAEELLNAEGLDGSRLVLQNGLRIYTTLDLDLQYQAECVSRAYITRIQGGDATATPNTSAGTACKAAQYLITPPNFKFNTQRNVTNSASVIIRPETGEILSMVGSLDYYNTAIDGSFNAAVQAQRQPGSAFKPFTYLTAFALTKYMPGSMVLDVPTTFKQDNTDFTPRNEDNKFHGVMSVRDALANSYNIPAVQVISNIGIGQVIRRARQLGINSLNNSIDQYGLALALGSAEVSVLDLTYAYSVFANLGDMAGTPVQNPRIGYRNYDPVAVLRIEDKDGRVLWEFSDKQKEFGKQLVLDKGVAYLINDILSDREARIPAFGRGNALELSRPAAAKTGTSNDNRDAWIVGYTPQLVMGVWVGNNNNTSMAGDVEGSTGAAPIWHAVMEYAHKRDNLPIKEWTRPNTIQQAAVCKRSGLRPTRDCPKINELFYADANVSTVPTQEDTYWKRYRINSKTGLIATASTPPDLVVEKIFFDYPPEARDWARTVGEPLPPQDFDTGVASTTPDVGAITTPASLARVKGGVVDVLGNLATKDVVAYTLAYGSGVNPAQWIGITGGNPTERGEGIVLGKWDVTGLDGLYTLRLSITLKDNEFRLYPVQVTVDNKAPLVRFILPQSGQTINSNAKTVRLEAEATDNVEVSHVEFYVNNQLVATVNEPPYRTDWTIDTNGAITIYAVVYDAAGNRSQSDPLRVNIP